jgi:predicted DNA-binding protein
MKKVKKERTGITTVHSIRIDKAQLKDIDRISKISGMDKAEIFRDAIDDYIEAFDTETIDLANEDYVNLRIDEERYLIMTGFKDVSNDLKKARFEKLDELKKKLKE